MSIPTKILIDWSLQRLAARVRGRTALRPALPRASEPLRQRRHSSARSSWGLHRRWNRSWPRLTRLIAWKTWRVGKCWNMLKPSAKIFSCAHTHRHRHEHRHRHRNTRTHTQTHTHTRSQYPKHHKSIVCLQWCNAVPGMPWLWSTDLALNGLQSHDLCTVRHALVLGMRPPMATLALWLYSKFPRLSRLLPDVTKECKAASRATMLGR